MILIDAVLSSFMLLLASGSCVYVTGRWAASNVVNYKPQLISACIGVLGINIRSLFNLFSPYIYSDIYSIHPVELADEDPFIPVRRVGFLHEKISRFFSNAGFIFAVCDAHGDRRTGIIIISTLGLAELFHVLHNGYPKKQRIELFHSLWMFAGGFYGWMKYNKFCFWAYMPVGISFLSFTPEIDYAWSVHRTVNNYLMMVHTFLMLEAIREAQSSSLQ